MFKRIRAKAGIPGPLDNGWAILLSCPWCATVWTTGFFAAVWFLLSHAVVVAFAAMGLAILIETQKRPD